MKLDVEDVIRNSLERLRWNNVDLSEIKFYKYGRRVNIPQKVIEEWRFTGLNNHDFIINYDWPEPLNEVGYEMD